MNISSLSGLTALQQQQNIQKTSAKLGAAIAALVSNSNGLGGDTASFSIASRLQAAVGGLKQISSNLAQASSVAQVADGGLEQLQNVAEKIQNLAQQAASPTANDANRQSINTQFGELLKQLDTTIVSTSFNGKKLLNGDLQSSETDGLSIDSLTLASLFGNQDLSLASVDGANNILAAVGVALNKITSTRANVGAYLQSTDLAAASVDSAIFNQDAARSTLQESDFAAASSDLSQATLQNNAALSLAAQGNRIPSALLQLVG
jgi:flagellin